MKIDPRYGKPAETHFKVLGQNAGRFLIEARPVTGRTHQIRVHLAHTAAPVLGDALYGKAKRDEPMALRSILLAYRDPFTRRGIEIKAPVDEFLKVYKLSAHETGFNEWKR